MKSDNGHRPAQKIDDRERLARVRASADRLIRLDDLCEKGNPAPDFLLRNELKILWRRALALWVRMRWPRLTAWWTGR